MNLARCVAVLSIVCGGIDRSPHQFATSQAEVELGIHGIVYLNV